MPKHIDDKDTLSTEALLRLRIDILDARLVEVRKERADAKKKLKKLVKKHGD
jgi:hypothetical protein